MLRNDAFDVICGLYPATVLIFKKHLYLPIFLETTDGRAPLLIINSCQTAKKLLSLLTGRIVRLFLC